MSDIYQFSAQDIGGEKIDFSTYRGHPMLIVNTASECGFTSQYQGLQSLSEKYASKGLHVLGFPCNQFGEQEPGDSKSISNFCKKNYGVSFQMFEKIDVNGPKAHPLYKYLASSAKGAFGTEAIKWNFTKFLIDQNGKVLKRYAPNVTPEALTADIEKVLSKP